MKKKIAALLAVLLAVLLPTLALAADPFEQYQIDRVQAEESVVGFVLGGGFWIPPVSKAIKAVPSGKRAQVVRAFGAAARAFTESEAFARGFAEQRALLVPPKPQPARDGKTLAAEQQAELEASLAETAEAIGTLPKEQQADILAALKEARASQAAMAGAPAALEAADKERYESELATYRAALEKLPPQDAREAVKAGLKRFLEVTAGVDFDARLVERDGLRLFADEKLEEKPAEWKLCFRAGKEATEAARAFAQEWLASLK